MRKRGLAGLLLIATVLAAKEPLLECGSYFIKAQEEAFLHARSEVRRAAARRSETTARAARANQDVGEIAVIGAGQGVVALRNPFDLVSKTLTFTPEGAGYKLDVGADTLDAAASTSGTRLALEDDDTERISLPFSFPFYGTTYTDAWVNSNGTVTFTGGDLDYSGAYGHFASGLPAIGGLFCDLFPPSSAGGVRLLREPGRVVITWDNVILATDNFTSVGQTFQIRFYPSGKIELTYTAAGTTLNRAVAGLNPGNLQPVTLVDLSASTGTSYTTGVAESFTSSLTPEIDMMAAAQRFYQTHDDAYDYLVVYNSMGIAADAGVVAYELTLRSSGEGYGDFPIDAGREFGSRRQLQAVMNLGPTVQYPADPFGRVGSRGSIGDTPVSILAHEAGHLFLALVSVPSPTGSGAPMLGAGLAHWAFPFHSDASVMEGNRIEDAGPEANPRYRTTATVQKYSALDQYLMGLRGPQDVPPTFAVLGSGFTNSRAPLAGVTFNGTRLDIPVEDVVKAAGRRTPDATVAQRRFRMAFIVVVDEDADLSAGTAAATSIAQVDAYRRAFEAYFPVATDSRGSVSTGLRRGAELSLSPAGGVTLNGTAAASIEVSAPAPAPLTFVLVAPLGVAGVPGSVTIPAGARRVEFNVTGSRVGVEELRAVPTDPAYEEGIARVQVNAASELRLAVARGDRQLAAATPFQPVVVRAVDQNKVPYSNQEVRVTVNGGGTVSPATARTNAFGEATFTWAPTNGSFNTLAFNIPGAPQATATAMALGLPAASPGGVVNGASFTGPLAPGTFATIFGGSLAAGARLSALGPNFPTTLGGVRVTIDGTRAGLTFVSDGQINFVVPVTVLPGARQLLVESALGTSAPYTITVAPTAPGIFLVGGNAAAVVAGTGLLTQIRAVKPGEFLEVYCTGLGLAPVASVTIGGVPAQVAYAGATAIQGLQQVNVRVPDSLAAGTQTLVLTVGGVQANPVGIQVGQP